MNALEITDIKFRMAPKPTRKNQKPWVEGWLSFTVNGVLRVENLPSYTMGVGLAALGKFPCQNPGEKQRLLIVRGLGLQARRELSEKTSMAWFNAVVGPPKRRAKWLQGTAPANGAASAPRTRRQTTGAA